MSSWLNKLVLVLAIAVMPLQGAAAAFSMLACLNGEDAHAAHAVPTHGDGDHAAGHDHGTHHGGSDDSSTGNHADDFCCHHLVSGLPLVSFAPVAPDFSVQTWGPQPLHDLFLPDRPQRPPLA